MIFPINNLVCAMLKNSEKMAFIQLLTVAGKILNVGFICHIYIIIYSLTLKITALNCQK